MPAQRKMGRESVSSHGKRPVELAMGYRKAHHLFLPGTHPSASPSEAPRSAWATLETSAGQFPGCGQGMEGLAQRVWR